MADNQDDDLNGCNPWTIILALVIMALVAIIVFLPENSDYNTGFKAGYEDYPNTTVRTALSPFTLDPWEFGYISGFDRAMWDDVYHRDKKTKTREQLIIENRKNESKNHEE